MRRANERRMSISPPCAAAIGRAVAAALMRLLYAHRAEDGVESLGIGNEQEKAVQALRGLVEEELRLHAKDRRIDARRMITDAFQSVTRFAADQRRGRQQQAHAKEITERGQVSTGENISSFIERRLFEPAEIGGRSAITPQHALGKADPRVNIQEKHSLTADVAAHRHLHRDYFGAR